MTLADFIYRYREMIDTHIKNNSDGEGSFNPLRIDDKLREQWVKEDWLLRSFAEGYGVTFTK